MIIEETYLKRLADKSRKLRAALRGQRSKSYCLRLWSDFVRDRDGNRCVDCHSTVRLSAHHICRKSFIACGQFLTGNGITLCAPCHRDVHQGFNRRPDLASPVDAQGGEKLACMERFYSILVDDGVERGIMSEEFYFLSDTFLSTLKRIQGIDSTSTFPERRVEQAYLILAESENATRRAMAEMVGAQFINQPFLPGGIYMEVSHEGIQARESILMQGYRPRSKP